MNEYTKFINDIEEAKNRLDSLYNDVCSKEFFGKTNESSEIIDLLKYFSKVKITVNLLETTLVGKTVNKYRKLGGAIGCWATKIVHKWKLQLIIEEEMEEFFSLIEIPEF